MKIKVQQFNLKLRSISSLLIGIYLLSLCPHLVSNAQVSGNVFNDNNSNGIRNTLRPNEKGVKGVSVKAFVGSGNMLFSKVTDTNGDYSFTVSEIPAGSKVRLEFSNSNPSSSSSLVGAGSQSSIQFVTAPTNIANYGLLLSGDYCQVRPPYFAVPCYVTGDPLGSTGDVSKDAAEGDALVAFDYTATGLASATNYPPLHFGLAKEVGSIWGVTFHALTNSILSTAIVKRHAGLGPLGTGGIYKTNVATGVVSNYVDVKTIGINTGPDPHSGLSFDKNAQSKDSLTFTKVGKVGIGGTDMSIDGKNLYISNLFDKKLYQLNIGKNLKTLTPADVKSYTIPNGGCSNNDYVAWGVTSEGSNVYIGVTCTAETSQLKSDLKAVIYRLDTTGVGTFTKVMDIPLGFTRGPDDLTGACINNNTWFPWKNTFPAPCDGRFVMYAQPILSDVYFDDASNLILGFMDRFGHQSGVDMPDLSGNGSFQSFMGGDLLKAHGNSDGTFTLENNAVVGTQTGAGPGNGQGPGGGEFFANDSWKFFGNVAHDEVLNGGLLVIPGYDEVLSTSFDPIDEVFLSSGWRVYDVNTGALKRRFAVFGETDVNKPYVRNGTFGKAAALGSGRAMCDPAPIEVGNRIWFDKDLDGLQDPDEVGIDGVTIEICDATTGRVIGKDTTANGGFYYFNNSNVLNTTTGKKLEYETNYKLKFARNQTVLDKYNSITKKGTGTSTDSDGMQDATSIFVNFKSGDVGQTNHSFDFGLTQCLKMDSLKVSACDSWSNSYRVNAFVAYNNSPIKNLKVTLRKPDGTIVKDTIIVPTTTASQQTFSLKNLVSNGLAGMKLSVSIEGMELDTKCKIDTTFNAPAQCTTPVPGEFLDPMGYIYCEETGEIIKGATIEVLGAKPAIILEDGSTGIYRWMVDPTAFGVYTMKVNIPAGYQLSTKCLGSNDILQLSGKPNPYEIGSDATDSTFSFMKSNACTTYYLKINIQFGDPFLHFNNIPLKGCCILPNAGADTAACATNTINLKDATKNQKWSKVIGNPAAAAIDSLTGVVTGMTAPGTYKFQLIYGIEAFSTCRDTIKVTIASKPVFTPATVPTTCLNGTMQANGKLTLSGFGTTDTYAFVKASTYNGSISTYAAATAIPAGGVIASTLVNPAAASDDYTIRVFNSAGCFKDSTVKLLKSTGDCCAVPPNAGKDTTICGVNATSVNLKDVTTAEQWSIVEGNPAAATIDASTGLASGLVSNGTYQFQLVLSATCRDTVKVIVGSSPSFTATTMKVTCSNGNMNANGMITLVNFTAGNKYAFTKGSTYSGSITSFAAATLIPTSGIIATTLLNPVTASDDYTIRVFNPTGCYTDVTTKLLQESGCCVPVCVPFKVSKVVRAKR